MNITEALAVYAIPALMLVFSVVLLIPKKSCFDAFLDGARSGLETSVRLLPTLVALMVAVNMLRVSGAVETLTSLLSPFFD